MSKKTTFPTNSKFDRWLAITGVSCQARRSTLPQDKPVYRI